MKKPKISIVVPIYNSEKHFGKCLHTLFEQTYENLEFIFINDATPDNSMKVLASVINEYPKRQPQIRILNNKTNMGTSISRNIGMNMSSGDYVSFCDSDDWVSITMYDEFYRKAILEDYDIVWCDYFKVIDGIKVHKSLGSQENLMKTIKNTILFKGVGSYLWNKMFKKEIIDRYKIRFPEEINIREDYIFVLKFLFYAKKIGHVNSILYYYNCTKDSTGRSSNKFLDNGPHIIDRITAANLIEQFYVVNNCYAYYKKEINYSKLMLKKMILANAENKIKYLDLFPESNKFIFSSPIPITTKISLLFASINCLVGYKFMMFIHEVTKKFLRFFNRAYGY